MIMSSEMLYEEYMVQSSFCASTAHGDVHEDGYYDIGNEELDGYEDFHVDSDS
jgi:hypothetical protein